MVNKNKNNHIKHPIFITLLTIVMAVTLAGLTASYLNKPHSAEAQSISELGERIEALKSEIAQNKEQADILANRAESLEVAIDELNLEIKSIQDEIDLTELKIEDLTRELEKTREELKEQEEILAKSLREHYKMGDVTTLELFASADSFSEFFNQREYLTRVRNSISESSAEIAELEKDLEQKKQKQESLLQQQETQQNRLSAKKSEKSRLLAQTRGQESRYRSLVSQNREQLEEAKQEQARLIAAAQRSVSYGGTGNYPWANVQPWDFNRCESPKYVDDWGMCVRQCVSYTAWAVQRDHELGLVKYDMPYWGGGGGVTNSADAKNWPEIAEGWDIPTGYTPKKGAIAISESGRWGHSMYVEDVLNGGSTIRVSQYNASLQGQYSVADVNANGLTYIYFQEWGR